MRFRFAPSPTGSLHLGNARTALLNWLCARGTGGVLVLRIEDTDVARNTPDAERALLDDLRWLGVDWDEGPDVGGPHGPYRQSERSDRYRELVDRLLERGAAYPCFCRPRRDPEVGDRGGDEAAAEWERALGCEGGCGTLPNSVARVRRASGEAAAIRLRTPADASWPAVLDGLRGEVTSTEPAHDFVIARANGGPVYQFAVVADDHDMQIDQVVRGQDHLSNTARQLLVYRALGWEPPAFTHLPLVLGEDRSRLSKRHGATSVAEMRARGVLPEALVNYLALLGWAPPDDREVLRPEELVELWRLEDISSTNVAFDLDKLHWLDQQHMLSLDPDDLFGRVAPRLAEQGLHPPVAGDARAWWRDAVDLVRGQAGGLDGVADQLRPLLDPEPGDRVADDAEREMLSSLRRSAAAGELASLGDFRAAARAAGAASGLGGRALFHPIRLALTGRDSGPELARLVPLLERGSRLEGAYAVPGVAERIDRALEES